MFRRPKNKAARGAEKRATGRRVIAPPELLEQRNAPSTLLNLPWIAGPSADGVVSNLLGDSATLSASQREESTLGNATQLVAQSPEPSAAQAGQPIQPIAPSNAVAGSGIPTSSQTVLTNTARPSNLAAAGASIATPMSQFVAMQTSVTFPSVSDPTAARTASPSAPVGMMTPPPSAASAATGGNAGGGSSNSIGGTSGNGATALPTAASVAATTQQGQPQATNVAAANTAAETTVAAASSATTLTQNLAGPVILANGPVITAAEVLTLLNRAAAATARNDAIIAIVDRSGQILGVRVEAGVPIAAASDTMVFAIDGAVAKAHTAAFFSNDQAPLTSRTVRFISQSTVTQREVQSNPNAVDPTVQGPGFVAPIGLGGHFPPGVRFTPHVDLFAIEHTNRDSVIHPGANGIREAGAGDDVALTTRFGANFAAGIDIPAPESYGFVSGQLPTAQSRGIATLPGGIPLFKIDPLTNRPALVGGIGVFFPGPDGFATFEQNFQPATGRRPQTTNDRLNAPLVKQAEYMAFAAAGGVPTIAGIALPAGFVLPQGRIDLAGITLEIYGPHPSGANGLRQFGRSLGTGSLVGGIDMPVTTGGDLRIDGESVPSGWLVEPTAGTNITAAEVRQIIERGVAEAALTRAAIRLPLGSRTRMVFSVTDLDGEILGLFRMPDATVFSIDVAVAKARNVAYYADPADLQPQDQVDDNNNGVPDVPAGTAFTNRTFRYLASPFFPTGVDGTRAGDFSILNDPGINPRTAENVGAPQPASAFTSVLGFDAFNPNTNFRELNDPGAVVGNQNGVVFFPGSTPLYRNGLLIGGFGVSGDGVDQDDVVTFGGAGQFLPSVDGPVLRADETFVRGIRLPYQKFNRNPRG